MGDIWEKLIFKWPFVGNFPLGKCYCSYFSNFTRDRQWKWNMIIATMKYNCQNVNFYFILLLVASHIKWKTPLAEWTSWEVTKLWISTHHKHTKHANRSVAIDWLEQQVLFFCRVKHGLTLFSSKGGWQPTRCLKTKFSILLLFGSHFKSRVKQGGQ